MNFEMFMRAGQTAHMAHNYLTALRYRVEAFAIADSAVEQGRATRDMGATFDRLGSIDEAEYWVEEAYQYHDDAVEAEEPNALRERSASSMYVGSIALRNAIKLEQAGQNHEEKAATAIDFLEGGLTDIEAHETEQGGVIDQYRINMTGRVALAEGLYGKRTRALHLGAKSIGLSWLSESAATSTYDRSTSHVSRLKSRINGSLRGVGSLLVTTLSLRPTRKLALKLANKVL